MIDETVYGLEACGRVEATRVHGEDSGAQFAKAARIVRENLADMYLSYWTADGQPYRQVSDTPIAGAETVIRFHSKILKSGRSSVRWECYNRISG